MANRFAQMKLNRQQKLLTAEQVRNLPPLYAQDGKGHDAIAYVKFFLGGYTWYATEFDPAQGLFFGLVVNEAMRDQMPCGELGYFSAAELCEHKMPVRMFGHVEGAFFAHVERDIHWKPCMLREALKREHGIDGDGSSGGLGGGNDGDDDGGLSIDIVPMAGGGNVQAEPQAEPRAEPQAEPEDWRERAHKLMMAIHV